MPNEERRIAFSGRWSQLPHVFRRAHARANGAYFHARDVVYLDTIIRDFKMKISKRMKLLSIKTVFFLLLSAPVFGQTDFVKSEGTNGSLHRANLGRITFML